ncbi:hypothetical protein HPP92_006592 [Vanilla planifolia]|uniref:Uncharacterized protein n=1 Tax=Vanilla planifolia TaxID=51239 RepID=A0A835V992_VANPL|nr:hypothetical protein HPP92_006592 [Vanilla planifolia]
MCAKRQTVRIPSSLGQRRGADAQIVHPFFQNTAIPSPLKKLLKTREGRARGRCERAHGEAFPLTAIIPLGQGSWSPLGSWPTCFAPLYAEKNKGNLLTRISISTPEYGASA